MNLKTTGLFAVLVLTWTFVVAADESWTEDIAAAIKTAEKEEKDLLLLYTGSDWCPPCKKLEADILSQEEFLDCLLYTSPSPRDRTRSRMPSSA